MKKAAWAVLAVAILTSAYFAGQYRGRRSPKPVEWLSQDIGGYIEYPIKCKSGKDLGKIWFDVNLTNGKWKVVRNDPGKYPSCN